MTTQRQDKLFLSYASEDADFAENLALALKTLDIPIWFAPGKLIPGDSIVDKINKALAESRFALLIISTSFLQKSWPKQELHALAALAIKDSRRRLIPVLHKISDEDYVKEVPMLSDIKWISSDRGLEWIVSHMRIILAEAYTPAMPQQRAVVEQNGTIQSFDSLSNALEQVEDEATIILYPGTYEAPFTITKKVCIVARGTSHDTRVEIPLGGTCIIDTFDIEIDGVTFLVNPALSVGQQDFELFRCFTVHPWVKLGDSMFAIPRHKERGKTIIKNCFFDAKNKVSYIVATDTKIDFRNTTLKNSDLGLAVRNGGCIDFTACILENIGSDVVYNGKINIINSSVFNSSLNTQHKGVIIIVNSQCFNCSFSAASESRISTSKNSVFNNVKSCDKKEASIIYATHYSRIHAEDSEFIGGITALYAYGGSLLTIRNVTIRKAIHDGVLYSEGCSGDIEDSHIIDCEGNGIRVQKGANPLIKRCIVEENGRVGITSAMAGNLNIIECHLTANGEGGIKTQGGNVCLDRTRIYLNDGPGVMVDGSPIELIDCEIGQNAHGQLLINGFKWYPPESILEKIQDFFYGRRNVKITRTTLY